MADEQRQRRRRQEDTELADVLQFLGDLERLGEKYDAGQAECRGMFTELRDTINNDVMPVVRDLERRIKGDPDDPSFPGLSAVVHELAEVESDRVAVEKYQERKAARRRLVIATVTTVAGGGVFTLLTVILSVLRQVAAP